jgi:superfamily II DNA or RNA helicase
VVLPDNSLLVPRGLRLWLIEKCNNLSIPYEITDNRTIFDFVDINSKDIKYRPYQSKAVSNLISIPEGILVSPAGSGKTVMGLSIIPMVGQPTLWLTHTGPLASQAIERAKSFLPGIGNVGMLGVGEWIIGDILTVGMVQTLIRRLDELYKIRNNFGVLICDECHRAAARTFLDVIGQFNPYFLYGLKATPKRRDRLEPLMYQALGKSKTVITIDEVSSTGGIIVPEVKCRFVNSKRVNSNKIQQILNQHIVNNEKRNKMIVDDVLAEAEDGRFCIVVSERRNHCEILYNLLKELWPKTGIATGKYSKKHVQEQVRAFNEGEITLLIATTSLLGEGFDVPFLDRAFLAMPFRSEVKTEQVIGRIQRSYPGKESAIVYDYIDKNIGVLENQFYNRWKVCRHRTYRRLGVSIS